MLISFSKNSTIINMDSQFEFERRERKLEEVIEELETELEDTQGKVYRIDGHSAELLNVLGVSNEKADLIYAVLDLEEDSRVDSVRLCNLGGLSAEVYLKRQFKDVGSLKSYLRKHHLPTDTISREGAHYRLRKPELDVTVYFSTKE